MINNNLNLNNYNYKESDNNGNMKMESQILETIKKSKSMINNKIYSSLGFSRYIRTLCLFKKNNPELTIYKSLIKYFQKQLDIVDLITLRKDVFLLKTLLFSEALSTEKLFDYKVSIENIVDDYELEENKEDIHKIDESEEDIKEKQINAKESLKKIQKKVNRLNIFS